jgi:hypothetical protein
MTEPNEHPSDYASDASGDSPRQYSQEEIDRALLSMGLLLLRRLLLKSKSEYYTPEIKLKLKERITHLLTVYCDYEFDRHTKTPSDEGVSGV